MKKIKTALVMHVEFNCNSDSKETEIRTRNGNAWRRNMQFLTNYLEKSFQILTVVTVAEIVRRTFRVFYEYFKYANHYDHENKFLTIIQRSFGMDMAPKIIYLIVAFACVLSRGCRPSIYFFSFMPLYWVFMTFSMGNSHFYYTDWIRQPNGLDYAQGMASNYFHGYLKLILPNQTGEIGLGERMELYENRHKIHFAIKRLFILVPNIMFVNSKIESRILTKDGVVPLETVVKNRAGVARPFKNDVYRFNVPINGSYYYVALEGATPLVSFFDTLSFQLTATWQMKEMSREILLKFYKHLKYLLNKWPETQGKAELILYNSYQSDGRPQDVGEVLLSHITNLWNKGE